MSQKHRTSRMLASFGGNITRYFMKTSGFVPQPQPGVIIAAASFGGGGKLAVTYRQAGGAI